MSVLWHCTPTQHFVTCTAAVHSGLALWRRSLLLQSGTAVQQYAGRPRLLICLCNLNAQQACAQAVSCLHVPLDTQGQLGSHAALQVWLFGMMQLRWQRARDFAIVHAAPILCNRGVTELSDGFLCPQ